MTTPLPRASALLVFALSCLAARPAAAQVMGTFRWQTQPYCNVLTLTIVQEGPSFLLTGTDDLCGAGTAPVTGTASVAGAGISMGVAIATPTGRVTHVSTTINLSNFSGTWIDADANTGPFAFVNTSTGGSPRPAPAKATLASHAQRPGWFPVNTSVTETAKLSDTGGQGGGAIVALTPIRLVLNGGVTIGNQAGTGPISMIECWFEGSSNGGVFAVWGQKQSTESIGNSNHDQRAAIPLSATVDLGPGTHNVRMVCQDIFRWTGSNPVVRAASFSAVAVSR